MIKAMSDKQPFELVTNYQPAGDQPQAIEKLVQGIERGYKNQLLLGVTGSGKTYTMANVIARTQRPTIVMAHNKTLAAQLYGEFKAFFPNNAVEYFVSYYDYYQPEAYVPSSDTFIEKDSAINDHIDQMRLSATRALLERRDAIIVASVSAIYGLGDPNAYMSMLLHVVEGDRIGRDDIIRRLVEMQYTRNELEFLRGTYRIRGEIIDIFPAESDQNAIRIELFDDEVDSIRWFDPLTGKMIRKVPRVTIYPKSHYVTPKDNLTRAIETIREELKERLVFFRENDKLLEAQRIEFTSPLWNKGEFQGGAMGIKPIKAITDREFAPINRAADEKMRREWIAEARRGRIEQARRDLIELRAARHAKICGKQTKAQDLILALYSIKQQFKD